MDKRLLTSFSILIIAIILTPVITKNNSEIKNPDKIIENKTSQKINNIFLNDSVKNNIFKKTEIIGELPVNEKITELFQNSPNEEIIKNNEVNSAITEIKQDSNDDEKNILIKELKDYGNQMGSVIKKYSPDSSKEIATFNIIITNNQNTEAIADLKNISAEYKILAENLSLLKIPEKVDNIQLNLANSYQNIPIAIDTIIKNTNKNEDFTKSLINYNEKVVLLTKSVSALSDFFKNNQISFSPYEDGYIFSQ